LTNHAGRVQRIRSVAARRSAAGRALFPRLALLIARASAAGRALTRRRHCEIAQAVPSFAAIGFDTFGSSGLELQEQSPGAAQAAAPRRRNGMASASSWRSRCLKKAGPMGVRVC
jgi:hypothetical protein